MPTDERVVAIVVNWNGRDVLPATLDSLRCTLHPNLEIVVVDNGSTDGSADQVRDPVRLAPLAENLGYGGALNAVLRTSVPGAEDGSSPAAEYFLLLNNDILVEPETVSRLLETAREKGPGVYGPKVLLQDRPDRLDAAWGRITWSHVLASFRGKGARDGGRYGRVRRVQLLLGCALLVHRRVFEDAGFFDEDYFMYHEEVDFLFRAGRRGYRSYFCPAARAYHRRAHSTRHDPLKRVFWVRRNAVLFLRKHRAGAWAWGCWGKSLVLSLAWNVVLLRRRRVATIWRGVVAGMGREISQSPRSGD
ncbi:MAG: glycosyltransferase family 2 protein [Acidobacteriota bacterium]|nr:glycosyltransferase family 2 protein [Acidobacteriota bacterium]